MGKAVLAACVVDAGALIAIDRGDRRIREIIRERAGRFVIPAPVLAEVWRNGARQARLARFIVSAETDVEVLDETSAKAVGVALARSRTTDVVDASVVVSARRHQAAVLSSDPEDLLRIDPTLEVERV